MYTGPALWNPGDGSGEMKDEAGMENVKILEKKVAKLAPEMKYADLSDERKEG